MMFIKDIFNVSDKSIFMNINQLKLKQRDYANRVILHDDFDVNHVTLIGGADVGFEQNGEITRAAIVLLQYPTLEVIDYQIARLETTFPYIPGFLSFREYPALLSAWSKLQRYPQLLFVDGQGVAHPRRLGIASHLGILLNLPTIGVAKKRLYGKYADLASTVGSKERLWDRDEQIGWVLRSKLRCNPLFISSGHRISQNSALYFVQQCLKGYRLPEPTRWADVIASNKPLINKLQQSV